MSLPNRTQRVPRLFSYLQTEVDERPEPGRFILTGSQHFRLSEAITQSLAGRVALLTLLPPSLDELGRFPNPPKDLLSTLWTGAYPRIFDQELDVGRWLTDYVTTYVQRDVRQLLNVTDLHAFTLFLRLAAGRTSTVKAPKLRFFDTGLVCQLLGIRDPDQLRHHPLRGAIFESWVASEIYKARVHRGLSPDLFHLRDNKGLEVDIVVDTGPGVVGVECKAGATVASGFLDGLEAVRKLVETHHPHLNRSLRLVYGGEATQRRPESMSYPGPACRVLNGEGNCPGGWRMAGATQ